jgi:hypothetical protein
LTIYYKGLQKLENIFVFVSLYKIKSLGLTEFKIYLFKMGREFVIRLSVDEITPINVT